MSVISLWSGCTSIELGLIEIDWGESAFERAVVQSSPTIRRVKSGFFVKLIYVSGASRNTAPLKQGIAIKFWVTCSISRLWWHCLKVGVTFTQVPKFLVRLNSTQFLVSVNTLASNFVYSFHICKLFVTI